MHGFLNIKKQFLFLLVIFAIVVPVGEPAFASTNTIDECFLNPEKCEDQPAQEGEQEVEENTQLTGGEGLTIWDYLKMLFALLFVLGLLLFVLRFINKKSQNYQQNSLVRNIGGVNLGGQRSVQLIQIGQSIYIVGVGEDVRLIKEVENPEEIEQIITNFNDRQSLVVTSPYITELAKKLKFKIRKTDEDEQKQQQSFGEILNNKLTDIKKNRQSELEKWKEKERDK